MSAGAAALFGGYGKEYQSLLKQAAAFHREFAAALATAGNAYSQAAVANAVAIEAFSDQAVTITTLVLGTSGYEVSPS